MALVNPNYSSVGVPAADRTRPAPAFGNPISAGVELLSRNKLLELIFTDFMGMTGPRSAIEYAKRGPDAGREALIREVPGAVLPVFLAGWVGAWLVPVINRLPWLNPHRIEARAWVNADSLAFFEQHFKDALAQTAGTAGPMDAQTVRQRFVRSTLASLQAADSGAPQAIAEYFRSLPKRQDLLAHKIDDYYRSSLAPGQLTPDGLNKLAALFEIDPHPHRGLPDLDRATHHWLETVAAKRPEITALTGTERTDALQALFRQKRLDFSRQALAAEKTLLGTLQETAVAGNLTEQVYLGSQGRRARDLGVVLRDLKHFLEQYGDRLLADPKTGTMNRVIDAAERKQITAQAEKLFAYTARTKRWLIVTALALSTAACVSVAYINNWITRQKYHGKVFFPGEGKEPPVIPNVARAEPPTASLQALALKPGGPFAQLVAHSAQGGSAPPEPSRWPKFGNLAMGSFLRALDFENLGESILRHSMIVYGLQNVGRGFAASDRSWNEVREVAVRDTMGFTFWFFATPITRYLFLRFLAPQDVRSLLIHEKPAAASRGLLAQLARLNPLSRFHIASSAQLRDRLKQLTGSGILQAAAPQLERYIQKAINWRNYAQALGIAMTIGLLGIGIPLLNIHMTRENVKKGKVGKAWA